MQSITLGEIYQRNNSSSEATVLNSDDILVIMTDINPYGHAHDDGDDGVKPYFTYDNYSGTGSVYYYARGYSYIQSAIPDSFTGDKIYIVGSVVALHRNIEPSSVYGNHTIVLTDEMPIETSYTNNAEGTIMNAFLTNVTYENAFQIKGVGGVRAGWNCSITISGKISDFTDDDGRTTSGKLIFEMDNNGIYLTNSENDYSGGTQFGGGNTKNANKACSFTVQANGTPFGTGSISFGYNGTSLNLNNKSITVGGIDGSNNISGKIAGSGTLTIDTDNSNFSSATTIGGTINLVKTGTGIQELSGSNTYNGTTTIEEGTLALPKGGTLYNLSGGSLNNNGTVAKTATLNVYGSELTINNNATTMFIGNITAKKITKTNNGIMKIFTGASGKVSAESLVISSGEIDFKGYMEGSILLQSDATFSPGNSVGIANIDGVFTSESNSTLLFEQDASGMDQLIADSFTIGGNTNLQLVFNALIPGSTYDIIIANDGFTTEQSETSYWVNLLTDDLPEKMIMSVVNGSIVRLHYDSNAVPEPTTWALLILGAVGLLFWRKRK